MDRLKQQLNDPETGALLALLKDVTPPEKGRNEWLVLENRVMSDVARLPQEHRNRRWFLPETGFASLLRAALKPSLAFAAVSLVLAGLFMLLVRLPSEKALSSFVTVLQGEVHYAQAVPADASYQREWRVASLSDRIQKNASVRLLEKGSLTVEMGANTGWRLLENSTLTVLEAGTRLISLYLEKGTILCKVEKRSPGDRFLVTTPNAICEVVGTRFKVEATEINGIPYTLLTVLEGKVAVTTLDRPLQKRIIPAPTVAGIKGRGFDFNSVLTDEKTVEREMAGLTLLPDAGDAGKKGGGILTVSSEPEGAEVLINGKPAGITPLAMKKPEGRYALSLSLPGYTEWKERLNLEQDGTQSRHAVLEKIEFLELLKSVIQPRPLLDDILPDFEETAAQKDGEEGPLLSASYLTGLEKFQDNRYLKALELFELTLAEGVYDREERLQVLDKIARCYRGLNNHAACIKTLEEIYSITENPVKKDNLLWEIASMKAAFLSDYGQVESDLSAYIEKFPDGLWVQEAALKLAEVQVLLKKPESAAESFKAYLRRFPESASADKAMYNLAYILGRDLNDCSKAVQWYTKLITQNPRGPYLEDALFWRADCLIRQGKRNEAYQEYRHYLNRFPEGRWRSATLERLESISLTRP